MRIYKESLLKSFLLFGIVLGTSSMIQAEDCFPESSISFPLSQKKSLSSLTGINEFQANQVIEDFKRLMNNEIKRQSGKKLIIKLDWENPKVNASATTDDDNNPMIILFGGMVRHPDLTVDGLYTILCHELGHHLGGAPKKFRGNSEKRSWSSAEGQSDYYAATKCLPLVFNQSISTPKMEELADTKELNSAEVTCGNDIVCSRILLAGFSIAKVFASLKDYFQDPSLSLEDRTEVWETDMGHPHPQCRLDTIRSGALCSVSPSLPFDGIDPQIGACYSYKNDGQVDPGARPRCWFNPELN